MVDGAAVEARALIRAIHVAAPTCANGGQSMGGRCDRGVNGKRGTPGSEVGACTSMGAVSFIHLQVPPALLLCAGTSSQVEHRSYEKPLIQRVQPRVGQCDSHVGLSVPRTRTMQA